MIGGELLVQLGDGLFTLAWLLLIVYALLGKPLFAVLGTVAVLAHLGAGLRLEVIFAASIAEIVDQALFVTIPLFVLAGTLLAESQAPARLVGLARALLGWLPGGLAIVATVCCAFFTAVTGASGVTIVALGGLLYPVLSKDNYPERFSIGLLTTGGSLGLLFVPSLPIIVYGLIAGVDIDTLFLAGIVPGLLLVLVLAGYSVLVGHRRGVPTRTPPWREPRELLRALRSAAWEAPIPLLIILGIYTGQVTAIEASAVTALYCLFVEVVVYRDIRLRELPFVMRRTAELVGAIMLILAMAMGVKNYLIDAEVPQQILAAMSTHIDSRVTFLLVLNVFLLIVGCLLDIFSAILVVVPLVAPLAVQFGVDPVHLGILFLTNLEIGYLTPPVGINLFLGSLRFGRPVLSVARAVIPFLLLLVACLATITYVPVLSTALVDLVRGAPEAEAADYVRSDGLRVRYEQWVGRDGRAVEHGRFESFYANGQKKEEGWYRYGNRHTLAEREGEPDRVWTTYDADGQRRSEGPYRFGRKHGQWRTWYPDGTLESEGTYASGKKHGRWRVWYEDGQLSEEGTYAEGLQHGHWVYWYGDDQKESEGEYVRDKPHGVWRNWDEDGERLPDRHWRHGVEAAPPG